MCHGHDGRCGDGHRGHDSNDDGDGDDDEDRAMATTTTAMTMATCLHRVSTHDVCMYISMHTPTYVCMYTHAHAHMHVQLRMRVQAHVCTYRRARVHTCVPRAAMSCLQALRIRIHMYVCTYMCTRPYVTPIPMAQDSASGRASIEARAEV